jgi:Ca2+-binding RTX toxin-like protein
VVNTADDTVIEGDGAGSGLDTVRSASIDLRLANYANIENLTLTGGNDLNLEGNAEANKLIGNAGANTIRGFAENDKINGRDGDDRLFGGDGADQITGGLGRDEMTGGGHADIFVFDVAAQTGTTDTSRDLIRDFNQAEGDLIDLSGIDTRPAAGTQAFDFIGMTAFSSVKGQLRFNQTDADTTRIQGDLNGDGTADFEIELTGLHTLVAGDFLL